jgi:hypothetical protein
MLRRIFFKKSNNPIKLGRWGTSLKNENSSQNLYLQTDLSNHDHCGSDICGAPSNSKSSINKSNSTFFVGKKKLSSKKNLSSSNSNIENNEEYFYPFLIGSWHVNYKKNK